MDVCRLALATTDLPENGGVVGIDFDLVKQHLGVGRLDNGDRITPDTARRMACDAGIIPLTLNKPRRAAGRGLHPAAGHRPDAPRPARPGSRVCVSRV